MTKRFPSKKPSKIGLEAKTCEMAYFFPSDSLAKASFVPRCQKKSAISHNAINCKNSLPRKYFSSLFLFKKFNFYLYRCL